MTLRAAGNLSQRRSLDPTEGNRGKYARVSCLCAWTTRNTSRTPLRRTSSYRRGTKNLYGMGLDDFEPKGITDFSTNLPEIHITLCTNLSNLPAGTALKRFKKYKKMPM